MKKTKTVYTCDLCKKECDHAQPSVFQCKFGTAHVCGDCIGVAVIEKLDKTIVCPSCKGKGIVKRLISYNESDWFECEVCRA